MSCPLHPELILEILCRLPVKSLCRFRCVSKSWLSLINHPTFAKLHLSTTQRQRLIISAESILSVDLENVSSNDDKVSTVELDFPCRSSSTSNDDLNWVSLVSSCNGLVCFFDEDDDLWLYNPSTNGCKQIGDFEFEKKKLHGFGYAESIDDYKYVRIKDPGKFVEVYSLREDSWKSIQNDLNVDFPDRLNEPGVPLNGAIHWVLTIQHQNVIASFDLIDEKFETSLLPDNVTEDRLIYSLRLLGDCLCLLVRKNSRSQLWVMKDYNDKASWVMILELSSYYLQPLSYLEDGKTLLLWDGPDKLVICNTKDGKFKIIEVDGIKDYILGACLHVESLVSPNCRTDITTEESLLGYLLE